MYIWSEKSAQWNILILYTPCLFGSLIKDELNAFPRWILSTWGPFRGGVFYTLLQNILYTILYSIAEYTVYHTPPLNRTPVEKIKRAELIISFFLSDPIQQKQWKTRIFHWADNLHHILIFVTWKDTFGAIYKSPNIPPPPPLMS